MVRYVEVCVKPTCCAIRRVDVVLISQRYFLISSFFSGVTADGQLLHLPYCILPVRSNLLTKCLIELSVNMFESLYLPKILPTLFIRLCGVTDTKNKHLLFYGKLHFNFCQQEYFFTHFKYADFQFWWPPISYAYFCYPSCTFPSFRPSVLPLYN